MKIFLTHLPKFLTYVACGVTAAAVDFGSYFLMFHFGVWYIAASVISGTLGFFVAFLLHKYVVFQKRDSFLAHLGKYFTVDMCNTALVTLLIFLLVEKAGFDPRPAKIITFVPMVFWNFFVYKFVVYV